jgi:4-carboxymuconolactone decarboxylase
LRAADAGRYNGPDETERAGQRHLSVAREATTHRKEFPIMTKARETSERYQRGSKLVKQLYGEVGASTLGSLRENAPQLADYIVEFVFGDVFSRPQLDVKTRELITVAALTAMGTAPAQLRAHIFGALNAGCTREEICEAISQMCAYAGFPAALNGIAAAADVFAKPGKKSRRR